MDRALLTGVTGFVGSHLARALLAAGTDVHALVRPGSRLDRIPDLVERITIHVDDGRFESLHRSVAAVDPDVTFHLATNFVGEHRPGDAGPLVADNVGFPARVADAVADAGAKAFVNVGTAWQHVDGASFRPKNLYAATKQAFEDVLRFYSDSGRLQVVTVNLYDTYGPQDHRRKLVGALVAAVTAGTELEMSSGHQLIDLVHVDDAVHALRIAAALAAGPPRPAPAGPYALSSGRPLTLRQLVEVMGEVAGRPVPVRWGARPDREGDMTAHWWAGPRLPGWSPEIELSAGLGALVEEEGRRASGDPSRSPAGT